MLITVPNSLSGDCGWEQFVLGLFKHGTKRGLVLESSVSRRENMFVSAGKKKKNLQKENKVKVLGFTGNLD